MPLFLVLVAVPIIEIALFIQVGGWLGLWPTLAIVVLTALIGTVLLRAQGVAVMGEVQRRLQAGENPSSTLAHGAMILVAGLLLLTPGFFTDTVGFLLLTPPVRAAAIRYAAARMTVVQTSTHGSHAGPRHPSNPGTVEGDYEVVEPGNDDPGQDGDSTPGSHGNSGWTRVPPTR